MVNNDPVTVSGKLCFGFAIYMRYLSKQTAFSVPLRKRVLLTMFKTQKFFTPFHLASFVCKASSETFCLSCQ